jgi:hypothetical protein
MLLIPQFTMLRGIALFCHARIDIALCRARRTQRSRSHSTTSQFVSVVSVPRQFTQVPCITVGTKFWPPETVPANYSPLHGSPMYEILQSVWWARQNEKLIIIYRNPSVYEQSVYEFLLLQDAQIPVFQFTSQFSLKAYKLFPLANRSLFPAPLLGK